MLPDPVLLGLFLPCSLPQLLTAAAGGGLEPSPARRFRGASPHRLFSYAKTVVCRRLFCSWHTQKSSFSASWMFRPRPALLITPKVADPKDPPGALNGGGLVRLNASARNCRCSPSLGMNSR